MLGSSGRVLGGAVVAIALGPAVAGEWQADPVTGCRIAALQNDRNRCQTESSIAGAAQQGAAAFGCSTSVN